MWPCTAAKCSDEACTLIRTTMAVVASAIKLETLSRSRTNLPRRLLPASGLAAAALNARTPAGASAPLVDSQQLRDVLRHLGDRREQRRAARARVGYRRQTHHR